MPRQKVSLSFEEARREIEDAPSYKYKVCNLKTGKMTKVPCAGIESLFLLQADAKALTLISSVEKKQWRVHKNRRDLERIYKAFPPELRYDHEYPILEAWRDEANPTEPLLISIDVKYLRVAVHQLLNHGIKKQRAFELIARIFPKHAPDFFKDTGDLKADAEQLRRCFEESEKLLKTIKTKTKKTLIEALKQVEFLQKELEKMERRCASLMSGTPPPSDTEEAIFGPAPEGLDFEEIEAWSAKEADLVKEKELSAALGGESR